VQVRGSDAIAQVPDEYKVKAVFLFHFAQFVEWPAGSFTGADDPMIIGVLGEDPFGEYLDDVVSGESINGHPLQVRRFSRLEDIDKCHILFVNAEGMGQLRAALRELEPRATLTVGDNPAFIRAGGMIRFFSEDNKIRLQINPEAARSSGLMISSKLLRLADISIPKS
jgi:preprotein translocase subunit Sec61beta